MPKYFHLHDDTPTFTAIEAETWAEAYYKAKDSPAHQPTVLCEQEMRDLQDNIGRALSESTLQPCRSPYCECSVGQCTHPGCYDARGTTP